MGRKYTFYDTDITGKAEYNISGQEYESLIETCCRYSEFFSLRFSQNSTNGIEKLNAFRINIDSKEIKTKTYSSSLDSEDAIRYYAVCEKSKQLLLEISDNIMGFIST